MNDFGLHRRDILRLGALAPFGLSLPRLLQSQQAVASEVRPAKAKACILLFMWGGPAQQDTWDPKPDSPVEYRGEFSTIATRTPGVRVCEHLPMLASRSDHLAIIRSMTHDDVDHTSATHYLLTGKGRPNRSAPREQDWPNYGGVMSLLKRGRGPLPPNISMMPVVPNGAPRFVEQSHGQDAGWLGPVHHPMRIDADASLPDFRVGAFQPIPEVPADRGDARRRLREALDRSGSESNPLLDAANAHYQRAVDLLASPEVSAAFDLSREPMRLRERYGMNRHGQSVLLARRLVEAGVPLITVFWPNDGITNVSVYWDTHSRNFIDLKTRLCPVTDLAFSALIDDLKSRGLFDETLIVWTGEMGRTPRVGQKVVGGAGAGRDGRDHWPSCFTTILSGAGIRGGTVHGSSDRYAAYPASSPTRPADLAATIYHLLGVDPHMQIFDRVKRPQTLCEGDLIHPVLS